MLVCDKDEGRDLERLRDNLMASIDEACGGNTTIENIVACIERGVGEQYVLALQRSQGAPGKRYNSIYGIFPDEVAQAIERHRPR